MRVLHLVTGLEVDISQTVLGYKNIGCTDSCVVQTHYFYSKRTYRGKLVVELRQHGVMDEDGGILLKSLQLLQKTLLVFLTAVPGGHWLEQGLPCSITPLQDHHLSTTALSPSI